MPQNDDDVLGGFAPAGKTLAGGDDDILSGFGAEQQKVKAKIGSNTTKPNDAATSIKLGKDLNVNPELVEADKDYYTDKKERDDALFHGEDKFIQDYITGTPLAVSVSGGDWKVLSDAAKAITTGNFGDGVVNKALQYFTSPIHSVVHGFEYGSKSAELWMRESQADDPWTRALATPKYYGRSALAGMSILGAPWAPIAEPIDEALAALGMPDYQRALTLLTLGGTRALNRYSKELTFPKDMDSKVGEKLTGEDALRKTAEYYADKMGVDPAVIEGMSRADLKEFVRRNIGIGESATKMSTAGVEVPKGMDKTIDTLNASQSKYDNTALDEAFKAVNKSMTKERSPDAVESFLNQEGLLQGKEIWIDADKVRELYKTEQPSVDDGKLGWVSGLQERLADAAAMGTEINLPRSSFLARTDEGTYGALRPFLRLRDTGLSPEEVGPAMDRHDPEHSQAKQQILEEQSGKEPETVVPTSEELAAEGFAAAEERKAKAAEEATGEEEAGLAPTRDPELEQAINRAEAESTAAHGLYDPEEWNPEMFGAKFDEIKGKPGANTARLAKLLGPKLYGEPKHMTSVTVKELMQNAFDAIKALLDKDPNYPGKIDIIFNNEARTVSMNDNGSGMTPEVLSKEFMQIAGTNKETVSASGGLGIAKMLTLFGNKGLIVTTMRNGKVSELTTSGEELFAALEDSDLAPIIKTRAPTADDLKLFPNKQGTDVQVTIPETYKDTATGETKDIEFSNFISDHAALKRSPLFGNIEVNVYRDPESAALGPSYGQQLPIGKNFPANDYTPFFTVKPEWGEAIVYVSKNEKSNYWGQNTHILSNGIWQFSTGLKKNPLEPFGDDVPVEVFIDVKPSVAPEDPGYPIDLNRQGFTADAKKIFDQVFAHISAIYRNADLRAGVESFGKLQYLTPGKGGVEVSEPVNLLPEQPKDKTVKSLGAGETIVVKDGKLIVRGKTVPDITAKVAEARIDLNELLVPEKMIKPDQIMLHNSLEIKVQGGDQAKSLRLKAIRSRQDEITAFLDQPGGIPESQFNRLEKEGKEFDELEAESKALMAQTGGEQWIDLLTAARSVFGKEFDNFMFEIGDVFKRLRDSVVKLMGTEYKPLLKEGVGISFDTKYRGVSTRVPFSGSFVNPAGTRHTDPVKAAAGIFGTMVHELAHHKVRSHNADFPAEMQNMQIYLDMAQILHDEMRGGDVINRKGAINALVQTYKKYDTIAKWLREKTSQDAELRGDVRYSGKRIKGTDEPAGPSGTAGEPTDTGLEPAYQKIGEGEGPDDFGLGPIKNEGATGKGFLLSGTAGQLAAAMINATSKSLYLKPLFKSPKDAGMTAAEFKAWSERMQEQDQANYDKALAAAQKEVLKRIEPEWQAEFMQRAQEVESDLFSAPQVAAFRYFKLGELPTGQKVEAPKMDRKAVEYMVGEKALQSMTKTDGVHPDDLAPTFGYQSGKEMVEALFSLEKDRGKTSPEQYLKNMVTELANQRMNAEMGSIEEALMEEAQKIALENNQVELMIEEMRQLAKLGGEMPFTKEQIKAQVEEMFDRTPRKEAKLSTYQRAMEKNWKDAQLALLKQDYHAAFLPALRRIRAVMAAKEAKRFEGFTRGAEKVFDRVAGNAILKTVDNSFTKHAQKVLSDLGRGPVRTQPDQSLTEFVDARPEVEVASWLYDPTTRRPDMTYDNMTVEEYEGLAKSIRSLLHVGSNWKRIGSIHDKADLDNVVFDIKKELFEVGPNGKPRFPSIPLPDSPRYGRMDQIKGIARWINSMNLLVERQFDYIDRFNPSGPLTRYFDRPLRDSYNEELKLTEATVRKLKVAQQYTDTSVNDIIDNKVIKFKDEPRLLTRQNMRYLLLHMGSKSGMQKVTEGFGITEDDAWDLIARNATENDIKWANLIWDLHEDLWRRGAAMEERVKGVAPDKIEALPKDIKLHNGTTLHLTGGYSPVKYDRVRSTIGLDIEKKQNQRIVNSGLFQQGYVQAITPSKWTVPRTDYKGALDLSGSMYVNHLTGMIHDIAFREAVLNARKLLLNQEFRDAFREKWGKEYDTLLDGWLRDIANSQLVNDEFAQGLAHMVSVTRQQIVSALTSMNVSTIVKHGMSAAAMSMTQAGTTGMTKAIGEMGLTGMGGALKDLVHDKSMAPDDNFSAAFKQVTATTSQGEQVRAFIYNSSPLMRARMKPYWNSVRGAFDRATSAGGVVPGGQTFANAREFMNHMGRLAVSMADFMSAAPEWYSAYKREFLHSGDHDQAVNVADRAVARAHGSSFVGDKPAILRYGQVSTVQGQLFKSLTALMQFWLHTYNNNVQVSWDIIQAFRGQDEPGARFFSKQKDPKYSSTNIPPISARLVANVVVAIMAEEMMSGWMREDKHGFGTSLALATIAYSGSFFPGIREVTNGLTHGYDPTFGMFGNMFRVFIQAEHAIENIISGKAMPSSGLIRLMTLAGMLTPFGSVQSGRLAQGLHGMITGKETPEGPIELLRQLSTGHPRPARAR